MDQNNRELIMKTLTECVQRLGIRVDEVTVSVVAGSTVFAVRSSDPTLLTGPNGDTLSALSHIVKKMLEQKIPHDDHYLIDVNGFHQRRIKSLEDQARLVAERARTFRYDIELSPMSSYERMIIHSTLKDMPDIETVSFGEGKLRHIVVRYKDPKATDHSV
jgi:spoIIIJ-associated protein